MPGNKDEWQHPPGQHKEEAESDDDPDTPEDASSHVLHDAPSIQPSASDSTIREALRRALTPDLFYPVPSVVPTPLSGGDERSPNEKKRVSQLRLLETLDPRNFRELTMDDLPAISRLYVSREMPTEMFERIGKGEYKEADELARRSSGYVDRWEPNPLELSKLQAICPHYESSGAEFRKFFTGEHGRSADFRAFGIFDPESQELRSISAMFVPPSDRERRRKHGEEVSRIFTGQDPVRKFNTIPHKRQYDEQMQSRAQSTAEFYLIGSALQGAEASASVVFNAMIEQLKADKVDISDFFLLHYDGFELLHPLPSASELPRMNAPNPSHNFGEKLGFWPFGWCKVDQQIAARQTCNYGIVVVRPIWHCMWAEAHDVHEHNAAIMRRIRSHAE